MVFGTVRKDGTRISHSLEADNFAFLFPRRAVFQFLPPAPTQSSSGMIWPHVYNGHTSILLQAFLTSVVEEFKCAVLTLAPSRTWEPRLTSPPCSGDPKYFIHSCIRGCDFFGMIWGMPNGTISILSCKNGKGNPNKGSKKIKPGRPKDIPERGRGWRSLCWSSGSSVISSVQLWGFYTVDREEMSTVRVVLSCSQISGVLRLSRVETLPYKVTVT